MGFNPFTGGLNFFFFFLMQNALKYSRKTFEASQDCAISTISRRRGSSYQDKKTSFDRKPG